MYNNSVINNEDYSDSRSFQKPSILYICGGNLSTSPYLDPLIDWRHKQGYVVNVVSSNDAGSSTTNIKNYISNAYNTWENPPEHVCFIGDADGSIYVSTYTVYGGNGWSTASGEGDFPYSLLEGNDLLPEVTLGRISIRSTTELITAINKIIGYEKNYANDDEWLILINAETKLNVDHSVMIGRRNESLDEIDNSDFPELPKIENGLSVAVSHNNGNSYEFSKDLRSTNTQNGVWNISIKSKSNSGDINFSLNEIMSLPEGVVISVLDVQSRHVYENTLEEFIVINKNNNLGYELKVIIGEPSYVQTKILELLTIIPSEFVLDKNFPNPFNPITKMYYTLPKRSLVSVKVYNMLGKEVVTLLEKEQSFGKYSISWNGQNNFGKQVSSGVYFAEIRASGKRRINKMLLMK